MDELTKGLFIFAKAYDLLKEIKEEDIFAGVISILIDQWAADHDMTTEQTFEMKKIMLDAHNDVYAELGMMDKTF